MARKHWVWRNLCDVVSWKMSASVRDDSQATRVDKKTCLQVVYKLSTTCLQVVCVVAGGFFCRQARCSRCVHAEVIVIICAECFRPKRSYRSCAIATDLLSTRIFKYLSAHVRAVGFRRNFDTVYPGTELSGLTLCVLAVNCNEHIHSCEAPVQPVLPRTQMIRNHYAATCLMYEYVITFRRTAIALR